MGREDVGVYHMLPDGMNWHSLNLSEQVNQVPPSRTAPWWTCDVQGGHVTPGRFKYPSNWMKRNLRTQPVTFFQIIFRWYHTHRKGPVTCSAVQSQKAVTACFSTSSYRLLTLQSSVSTLRVGQCDLHLHPWPVTVIGHRGGVYLERVYSRQTGWLWVSPGRIRVSTGRVYAGYVVWGFEEGSDHAIPSVSVSQPITLCSLTHTACMQTALFDVKSHCLQPNPNILAAIEHH